MKHPKRIIEGYRAVNFNFPLATPPPLLSLPSFPMRRGAALPFQREMWGDERPKASAANSMILRLPLFRHNCAMFVNKYSVTGEQINILLQGVLLVFHILYNTR